MSKRKSELPTSDDEHDEDKRTRHAPVGELEGASALSRPALSRPALSRPALSRPALSTPPPLYDDVLAVVFSFLTFAELTRACVCRMWRHAAIRMPCRNEITRLYEEYVPIVTSPHAQYLLARKHVRTVRCVYSSPVMTRGSQMQALAAFLPHLDTLGLTVSIRALTQPLPQLFAPTIRTLQLNVQMNDRDWMWSVGIQLMQTICTLTRLTSLTLTVEGNMESDTTNNVEDGPPDFLFPLLALPDLARLKIAWEYFAEDGDWSEEAIDVLRALPKLTDLRMSIANLAHFFHEPHSLKLQTIDARWLNQRIDINDTKWLESLPHMQTLHFIHIFEFRDLSFVSRLPGLRTLTISCDDSRDHPLAPLVSALANCMALTTLHIDHPTFNGEALERVLTTRIPSCGMSTSAVALPALRCLKLHLDANDKVAFRVFSGVPRLSVQLHRLKIVYHGSASAQHIADFSHLLALHALRWLRVNASIGAALPTDMLASFTPSSPAFRVACLPHLQHFICDSEAGM